MAQNKPMQKKFRPEIEGLRAVAALLMTVYHIWLHRVSGGVVDELIKNVRLTKI
ncbi:hypothetical protein [Macrococcus animalis]|uniref:hypothetical protein n=1 Tax=Macrococcus animalis TaxID=3395467 RepID=UPI0039BDC927